MLLVLTGYYPSSGNGWVLKELVFIPGEWILIGLMKMRNFKYWLEKARNFSTSAWFSYTRPTYNDFHASLQIFQCRVLRVSLIMPIAFFELAVGIV